LFLYYGISFVLSILALIAWTIGAVSYDPPGAHDGYGPDPVGIILYFALWLMGFLLLHSALLAWIVRKKRPATVLQGRWGLAIHTALGVALLVYVLYLTGTFSNWLMVMRMRMS